MTQIQVGKTVKFKGDHRSLKFSGVTGKVIGIRMINAEDTKDLLCTVEWCDHISDAFDFDLEVVENLDSHNQTS